MAKKQNQVPAQTIRRIGENRERRQELISIINIALDLLDEVDFDNNGFEDKTRQYEWKACTSTRKPYGVEDIFKRKVNKKSWYAQATLSPFLDTLLLEMRFLRELMGVLATNRAAKKCSQGKQGFDVNNRIATGTKQVLDGTSNQFRTLERYENIFILLLCMFLLEQTVQLAYGEWPTPILIRVGLVIQKDALFFVALL